MDGINHYLTIIEKEFKKLNSFFEIGTTVGQESNKKTVNTYL